MKKKWISLTAVLMALLVLLTSVAPAVAENEKEVGSDNQSVVKALGIDTPRRALVRNEITITIFERGTQKPVSGAGVWAISPDKTSDFQSAVAEIDIKNTADQEYESMCNLYGEFLGKTSGQGELKHAFVETGRYLLVATKNHYYPGFSQINIYEKPKALGVRAPRVARVDTDVTMTVFDRFTNQPVQGAGVWAFSRENAEAIKGEISNIRAEIKDSAMEYDYESLMNIYGEFLGRTNDEGQLTHGFDETGKYILVTWKPGYWPGFAQISIKENRQPLAIRAPRLAFVDKEITMTVYEKPGSLDADVAPNTVEEARIWALSIADAETLKQEIEATVENDEATAIKRDYESMISFYGKFLGLTDENGQLRHTFDDTGEYVLVTWKQGYWPGYARLTVRELPNALGIEAPRVAQVDEDVIMKVFQRGTGDPVGRADMWAFAWDQTDSLKQNMADIRSLDSSAFDYESICNNTGGIYLGQTNNSGELRHSFNNTGRYLLLAFKDGYWPGFGWIKITELQPAEPLTQNEFSIE
ncbi:hypothetical protein ACFLU3_00825 [Chloroflexota bacterium]